MNNGIQHCIYIAFILVFLYFSNFRLSRLKEIVYRFEEPNDRRKWDDPCYIIHPEDTLPLEDIYNFVCQTKFSSKPNQATVYVYIILIEIFVYILLILSSQKLRIQIICMI